MPVIRSKVSSKGQITIPLEIRKRMAIGKGDQVEFDTARSETVIRPVREVENPFDKWRGAVGGFPGGRREINAWIREIRGRDQDNI